MRFQTVKLSHDDQMTAIRWTNEHAEAVKRKRARSKRVSDKQSDFSIMLAGYRGEVAFSKFFPGAVRDGNLDQWSTIDFVLNGVPIDVKTSTNPNMSHLVIADWVHKKSTSHYARIRVVDNSVAMFDGFFPRNWIDVSRHRHPWRKGLWIPRAELVEFSTLLDAIRRGSL